MTAEQKHTLHDLARRLGFEQKDSVSSGCPLGNRYYRQDGKHRCSILHLPDHHGELRYYLPDTTTYAVLRTYEEAVSVLTAELLRKM